MSSIWPSAVASNSNLYIAVDFPNSVTALNGPLNSTDTVINVSSTSNYPSSGGYILIDSELITFSGISGNQLTGCTRGVDGTAAASHLSNAVVNMVSMAEHHNVLKDEVIAIENSLNLTTSKALISNGSGRVDVSVTTSAELVYLSGVTSAIQTQLNSKIDTAGTGLSKSGTTLNLNIPVSVTNGGTGQTTYTDGQLLIGNSSGNTLAVSTLAGTANQINITNGHGSITLSTPQNIDSTATPTFASETLSATTNQLVLGTTNTVTISSTAPASSRTYTIPDAGGSANVVLDVGNYTIGGLFTFNKPPTLPVATISGSGTVTPDATVSSTIATTVTGALIIQGPTGGVDGQKLTFRLLQNATGYAVTFSTGSGNFRFGTDITSFTASGANLTDYVGVIWNTAANVWDIVSVIQGF